MKRFLLAAIVTGVLGLSAGCFLDPIDMDHKIETEVVLQGFLTPGGPVEVVLRSTVPPTEYYSFMDLDPFAIGGAVVSVTIDGTAHDLTPGTTPGSYHDPALVAKAGITYSIDVTFPSGHQFADRHVTATTTVPERVSVTSVTYHAGQEEPPPGIVNIEAFSFPKSLANPDIFPPTGDIYTPFNLAWDAAPGAAGYTVGVLASDTTGFNLMRKREYKDWVDGEYSNPADRQFMAKSGFMVMEDSLNADIYWMLFHYEGPTNVVLVAADEGYWQYFRTYLGGPGGNSGNDSDTGVALNVEGGIGVFGSYTADTVATHIANEWRPDSHRSDCLNEERLARLEAYEASLNP
jgi:hypothetical protein